MLPRLAPPLLVSLALSPSARAEGEAAEPAYPPPYTPAAARPWAPPAAPPDEGGSDGTGLIIGGAITFALFYGASALTAAGLGQVCAIGWDDAVAAIDGLEPEHLEGRDLPTLCGDADTDAGYIPVAGPFVTLAKLDDEPISVWPVDVALASLGVGQITGLTLLLGGLIQRAVHHDDKPALTVGPDLGPSRAGIRVRARF